MSAQANKCSEPANTINLLGACPYLPKLPIAAKNIADLYRQPDVKLTHVADIIVSHDGLEEKILEIANSPLYLRMRSVDNLRQAIMLFGLNGSLSLALGYSIVSTLKEEEFSGLNPENFWRRALASATFCKILGEKIKHRDREDLFLCGLLQDIGMLALDVAMPELYFNRKSSQSEHRATCDFERNHLDSDHSVASDYILKKWNIPELIRITSKHSHATQFESIDAAFRAQSCCVAISSYVADLLCAPEPAIAVNRAASLAKRFLTIGRDSFTNLLEIFNDQLNETFMLFEIEPIDEKELRTVVSDVTRTITSDDPNTSQQIRPIVNLIGTDPSETVPNVDESLLDRLTGFYNRDYLEQELQTELDAARKQGWPLAIIMLELDSYDALTENYGSLMGSRILQKSARILRSCTRDTDLLVRYDEKEMAILLPGIDMEEACSVAEHTLNSFRTSVFLIPKGSMNVSEAELSSGVSVTISAAVVVQGEGYDFATQDMLIYAARKTVEIARNNGRDRYIALRTK